MLGRLTIPWIAVIWVVAGLVVAINKGFADSLDGGSEVATFVLAIAVWPIPALDGNVLIQLP